LRSPLLGLYSAFKELINLGYNKAFIFACDLPMFKFEAIKLLIDHSNAFDCVMPRWNNGFLEPLFAIYNVKKAFESTRNNLYKKDFKLVKVIRRNWKVNYISIENQIQPIDKKLRSFININKPSDIERLY
jgi:molybdopterin-guanine dinucleotide biosynthesis protein A